MGLLPLLLLLLFPTSDWRARPIMYSSGQVTPISAACISSCATSSAALVGSVKSITRAVLTCRKKRGRKAIAKKGIETWPQGGTVQFVWGRHVGAAIHHDYIRYIVKYIAIFRDMKTLVAEITPWTGYLFPTIILGKKYQWYSPRNRVFEVQETKIQPPERMILHQ